MKQITQSFLEGESPTLISALVTMIHTAIALLDGAKWIVSKGVLMNEV